MDGTLALKKYNVIERIEALEEGGGELPANVIVEDDVAYQFSTTTSYLAGSFVYKDNQLYRFDVDHAAGAWNSEEVTAVRISDSIISEFGDGLQRTGNEVYVKLKSGGGLEFDTEGALYTNVVHNYSTNEQPTGQNWIDGSPIYFKTINFGVLPDSTYKSVNSGLTNVKIIKMEGIAISSDYTIPLPEPSANNQNAQMYYEYASNSITIATSGSFSGYTESYVTLYYIKNTTSKKKTNK